MADKDVMLQNALIFFAVGGCSTLVAVLCVARASGCEKARRAAIRTCCCVAVFAIIASSATASYPTQDDRDETEDDLKQFFFVIFVLSPCLCVLVRTVEAMPARMTDLERGASSVELGLGGEFGDEDSQSSDGEELWVAWEPFRAPSEGSPMRAIPEGKVHHSGFGMRMSQERGHGRREKHGNFGKSGSSGSGSGSMIVSRENSGGSSLPTSSFNASSSLPEPRTSQVSVQPVSGAPKSPEAPPATFHAVMSERGPGGSGGVAASGAAPQPATKSKKAALKINSAPAAINP